MYITVTATEQAKAKANEYLAQIQRTPDKIHEFNGEMLLFWYSESRSVLLNVSSSGRCADMFSDTALSDQSIHRDVLRDPTPETVNEWLSQS